MSVNINVHSNPISYKKDHILCEHAKNEEIKRRKLLRLEQVRQQSKELAKNLRKKVEEQKQQQRHKIEQTKKNELKSWKERHVRKTEQQYKHCLNNIGAAHFAAAEENELMKKVKAQQIKNRRIAEKRGREALAKVKQNKCDKNRTVSAKKNDNLDGITKCTKTTPVILNISSDSHSSSCIEVPKTNRNVTKSLPLAYSRDILSNDDEMMSMSSSLESLTQHNEQPPLREYNAMNYEAETSAESNVPFTQVSDLLKQLKQNEYIEGENVKKTETPREEEDVITKVHEENKNTEIIDKTTAFSSTIPTSPPKPVVKSLNLTAKSPQKIPSKPKVIHHKSKSTTHLKPIPKRHNFIPQFSKVSSSKMPSVSQTIPPVATTRSASLAKPIETKSKVQFYDHSNRFSKEYDASENIVQKDVVDPLQPNAMAAAIEESHKDAEHVAYQEELNRLSDLRCQQALEREKARKDYDLLLEQLEEVQKRESSKNAYVAHFSELRMQQMAEERQKQMNKLIEAEFRPVLITCPKVPIHTDESSSSSGLNVAAESSNNASQDSNCSSILIDYMDNRSKNIIKNIGSSDDPNKNNLLKLLCKINEQKQQLLKQIEQSGETTSEALQSALKSIQEIEKEREQLLQDTRSHNKENKEEQELQIEKEKMKKREKQIKAKEAQLEQKIKELFLEEQRRKEEGFKKQQIGRNVEIQTDAPDECDVQVVTAGDSKDESTNSSSATDNTPLRIIINVNSKKGKKHMKIKSPRRKLLEKQKPKVITEIKDLPGLVYPKTPVKKTTPIIDKATKDIGDGSSTSTAYRSLPQVIQSDLTKALSGKPIDGTMPKQPMTKLKREPIKISSPALAHYITRLLGMSRVSIEQLGVNSISSIETPSSSVVNVSDNYASSCNEIINEERMEKLKKFIAENHSFLNEMEESLKQADRSAEEKECRIEQVWQKQLEDKEKEAKQLRHEEKKLKDALIQREPQKQPEEKRKDVTAIKPILKKPSSPKRVILHNKNLEGSTKSPDPYKEITDNCSKRIADLTEMIQKVREEKQKLLENTFSTVSSSSKDRNSTEYLDFENKPMKADDNSSQASDVQTLSNNNVSEDNRIKLANSKFIGISRDSGICISRPLTSTDIRDSPDVRQQLQPVPPSGAALLVTNLPSPPVQPVTKKNTDEEKEDQEAFEPILKGIPKYAAYIGDKNDIADLKIERSKSVQKSTSQQKPPTALKRYSPQLDTEDAPHELSTIAEVDTPAMSRLNTSIDQSSNISIPAQPAIERFITFEEYVRLNNLDLTQENTIQILEEFKKMLELSAATKMDLQFRKFTSPTKYLEGNHQIVTDEKHEDPLKIKQFPSHEDYAAEESNLCNSESIEHARSWESLPNVEEELKKRNLIQHSFDMKPYQGKHKNDNTSEAIEQPKVSEYRKKPTASFDSSSNSPPDTLENDMNKMGLTWASAMIKKSKEVQAHTSSTTSTSSNSIMDKKYFAQHKSAAQPMNSFIDSKLKNDVTNSSSLSDQGGKRINLKEFLAKELLKRSQSSNSSSSINHDSSLASKFLRSLLGSSDSSDAFLSQNQTPGRQRTSTPVKPVSMQSPYTQGTTASLMPSNQLFSGESAISSVRPSSMSSSGKDTSSSCSIGNSHSTKSGYELNVPDLNLNLPSSLSS